MNVDETIGDRGSPASCCAPLAGPHMSAADARTTAGVFKALADPARVRIVNEIARAGRAVCVCELTPALGLSQPTVSHHLRKLLDAGLLARYQRGTWSYYSIDREAFTRLASIVLTEVTA